MNESICIVCGKRWEPYQYSNPRFCSNDCFTTFKYNEYIKLWKLGKVSGGRKEGLGKTSNHVRKYLFIKYNNKCSICGWGETNKFTNTIPLEVEHINGNPEDHREENLILLCPNCHSLTPGHSSKKGNGRRYYRELYRKQG